MKYRPPENREPLLEEKEACRVWVNAELLFIKPKVIVALGRHALERFLPQEHVSIAHGQVFIHSSGIPVFAMYHPAAALYNPTLKETLQEDFYKLKDFLDGKIQPLENENDNQKEKQLLINEILKL